jgi:hypothetical protein
LDSESPHYGTRGFTVPKIETTVPVPVCTFAVDYTVFRPIL